jgi:hypothetical protein
VLVEQHDLLVRLARSERPLALLPAERRVDDLLEVAAHDDGQLARLDEAHLDEHDAEPPLGARQALGRARRAAPA